MQSRYYDPKIGRFINADVYTSTGQGTLGFNMFAYCNNNPMNGYDPCGTCFHRRDFWNDCDRCRIYGYCGTASVGAGIGISLGPWSYSIQISFCSDMEGNSEVQLTYATALSTNTPAAQEISKCDFTPQVFCAASMAFTNAPHVSNLHGEAHQVGGAIPGAGIDICFLPAPAQNTTYSGVAYSAGIISPDVHYSGSTTVPLAKSSFNVFEYLNFALDLLGGKYQ